MEFWSPGMWVGGVCWDAAERCVVRVCVRMESWSVLAKLRASAERRGWVCAGVCAMNRGKRAKRGGKEVGECVCVYACSVNRD